ncbi:MAG: type II secretion system protein [Planctomycetota bacterium]|nr:type II secretion system protein [Planctomycetota bacterium]
MPIAPPHLPNRTRAFSLIELLVSISIISVLMGIILTVLPGVRDSARRTACGANLRSIGTAIQSHRANHRDTFPVARYMPPPWLSGDTDPPLNVALEPYMEPDSEAYQCPGDRVVWSQTYETEDGQPRVCGMSYTYVAGLSGLQFEQTFYATFLQRTTTNTPVAHDYDGGTFETQDGRLVPVDFFHESRSVLYVDGHVDSPKK